MYEDLKICSWSLTLAFRFTELICLTKMIMQWCFHPKIYQGQDFFNFVNTSMLIFVPGYWHHDKICENALWLKNLQAIYSSLSELWIFNKKIGRSLTYNYGKVPLKNMFRWDFSRSLKEWSVSLIYLYKIVLSISIFIPTAVWEESKNPFLCINAL